MGNLTQRIRQNIYQLKREYGGRIVVYKLLDSETDVRTGVKTQQVQTYKIERAAVLPMYTQRKTPFLPNISTQPEFCQGAAYDSGLRDFIVDRRDIDLPTLTNDDWIVYRGEKYQVSKVEAYEVDSGWIIETKRLIGEQPSVTWTQTISDNLAITSEAEGENE